MNTKVSTPWGLANHVEYIGNRGIMWVDTPSHGGVYVPPEVRAKWPAPFDTWVSGYAPENWFEEDCDWCIPFLLCQELQDQDLSRRDSMLASAWDTLKAYKPVLFDEMQKALGVVNA